MREFKVLNSKPDQVPEQTMNLHTLIEQIDLGSAELDDIVELEVGETYNLDSTTNLERIR